MATARKNFRFILLEKSEFYVVVNLSISVRALPIHMLTSLSVDEITTTVYERIY